MAFATGDLQSITADMSAVAVSAGALDEAGTMQASAELEATATRLLAYLASHPAADCYAALQADITKAVEALRTAGIAGSGGDFTAGGTAIQRGGTLMESATSKVPAANAACTG